MKLPQEFYRQDDVTEVARALLGKLLCSRMHGTRCSLRITETEAYAGETDRASHAFGACRTARTEPMYAAGGCTYIYLCYGIHNLFNVVSGPAGVPHAVLVRAGVPHSGVETMLRRRKRTRVEPGLLAGPGMVGQALGITTALTGIRLSGDTVWIEDDGITIPASDVRTGPRIGVDYAGKDADLPYRFVGAGEHC